MNSFNHAITSYMESEESCQRSYSTEHIFNCKENREQIEFGLSMGCDSNNGLVSIELAGTSSNSHSPFSHMKKAIIDFNCALFYFESQCITSSLTTNLDENSCFNTFMPCLM